MVNPVRRLDPGHELVHGSSEDPTRQGTPQGQRSREVPQSFGGFGDAGHGWQPRVPQ